MNIFVLSFNPGQAAQALCDKHVPKMLLETAQLLCSPFEPGTAPYKRTHYNHPCTKWVRATIRNYVWGLEYLSELCHEYTYRFGKKHKSEDVWEFLEANWYKLRIPSTGKRTPFAQAMPEQYRHPNAVTAYRAYYIGEKARFAKWERGRKPPKWWPEKK